MILERKNMPYKRFWAPAVGAAVVGGAASLLGAGISAAGSANLNKKTMQFNSQEAEKQRAWSEKMYNDANAWNYRMWQEENAYNSPTAQLDRLQEAGLNPLYYGLDGNSTNGSVQAAQPLGYDRAQATGLQNPLAGFADIPIKVAQIANIQADTAKKNNENLTETQRREKLIADIEVTKQELQNKLANEKLTDAQRERIEKDIAWCDRLNEATLAEKEAKAKLDKSQQKRVEELLEGEKILQSKNIEDFEHKWKKIQSEIAKMAKETGLLEKDIENYAINHANNGFMGSGLSINNIIRGLKQLKPKRGQENNYGEDSDWRSIAQSGQ